MIHDSLDQLQRYSSFIGNLDFAGNLAQQELKDGVYIQDKVTYEVITKAQAFPISNFVAYPHTVCLHIVLDGEEILATTYAELSRHKKEDEQGRIMLPLEEPTAVVHAKEGMFTLFMQGEPMAFGLGKEIDQTIRTLTIWIED